MDDDQGNQANEGNPSTPESVTPPAVPSSQPSPPVTPSNETPAPSVTPRVETPLTVSEPVIPSPAKSHRWITVVIIVVIIALLGGGAYAAYHFSRPKKQAVTTSAKKEVPLVRVGIQDLLSSSFYPDGQDESGFAEVNRQVFEGLTGIQDNTKIVPLLATSWTTPTDTTWIFHLRKDVYFHDGHLMTAGLVKASLDSAHDGAYWQTFGSHIDSVAVVDPNTIKITTDGPDPLLTIELANLWIYDTTSGKDNDAINGTGPYALKPGSQPSDQSVKLTAYDKYWGGRALTREVDFSILDNDEAAAAAIKAGKLDLANFHSYSAIKALGSAYKQQTVISPQVTFFVPNVLDTSSPLSKLGVRQAVYAALDPAALSAAQGDQGTPIGQIVPQEIPGYDASLKPNSPNITKAKQLLAAAGYPNGFTIKLTHYYTSSNLEAELQKEWAKIGVTVVDDSYTDGEALQDDAYNGKTQLFYNSYSSDLLDTNDVVSGMLLQGKNYDNPSLTALSNQAATELNATKRLKLLQQENQMVMKDLALFPLYQRNSTPFAYAASKGLVMKQEITNTSTGLYYNEVYRK